VKKKDELWRKKGRDKTAKKGMFIHEKYINRVKKNVL
jgi:hypothetical protein